MYLGNVAAGEFDDRRTSSIRSVRWNENRCAGLLRFCKRSVEIWNLVAGRFAPVRIRKLSVGNEYRDISEARIDTNAAVCDAGSTDFDARGVRIVRRHRASREAHEVATERIGYIRRHVDAILWNRREGSVV